MKRVLDFLKKAEVYYLATVEGDQPRVRPFGTINEFEGKLYIQTGKVKPTSKQLAANPKAEICAFCDGAWIRVACRCFICRMQPQPSVPSVRLPLWWSFKREQKDFRGIQKSLPRWVSRC